MERSIKTKALIMNRSLTGIVERVRYESIGDAKSNLQGGRLCLFE